MKTLRARVERVDDHFAVGRTGDLHPAVLQVGGRWGNRPLRLPDVPRLRQEIGQLAPVEPRLPLGALLQQLLAPRVELAGQRGDESHRFGGQDFAVLLVGPARNRHAIRI